ncbi:hypothetical protein H0H92_003385 [Tricholoma furcatifolium]|nr:hypothetical protein H0H92_003385 [Tricholoma furcatifolium]
MDGNITCPTQSSHPYRPAPIGHDHNDAASPLQQRASSTIKPGHHHAIRSPSVTRAPSAVLNGTLQDIVITAFSIVFIVVNVENNREAFRQLAEHVCFLVYFVLYRAKAEDQGFDISEFTASVKKLRNLLSMILDWARAHHEGDLLSPEFQSENSIPSFQEHLESFLVVFGFMKNFSGQFEHIIRKLYDGRDARKVSFT